MLFTNLHSLQLHLKIICTTLGHDYVLQQKITNHIYEYKCCCCGREVSENASGKLELLTVRLKEVNSSIASFFKKKNTRMLRTSAAR